MAIIPWRDHLGNTVQDHNGVDIQFKRTKAQINMGLDVSATVKLIVPMSVNINMGFTVTPTLTIKTFLSSSIRSVFNINAQATKAITKWKTIMFKYIGDRDV